VLFRSRPVTKVGNFRHLSLGSPLQSICPAKLELNLLQLRADLARMSLSGQFFTHASARKQYLREDLSDTGQRGRSLNHDELVDGHDMAASSELVEPTQAVAPLRDDLQCDRRNHLRSALG
ncbi:hypothetical protein, partial [Mesorhizobium sp. M4B.F.Ca.ET.214.01.1.1]|uniref:hypothetical protein n=1 Tax=Mesorhizobium sp. M4B.F.Ca.ET.214.01.1.1 TaxID=2563955 RepID=UPI001AEF026C